MTMRLDSMSGLEHTTSITAGRGERPHARTADIGFVLGGPDRGCVEAAALAWIDGLGRSEVYAWKVAFADGAIRQGRPWQPADLERHCRWVKPGAGVIERLGDDEWVADTQDSLPFAADWWFSRVLVWVTPRPTDRALVDAL